ncbi:Oxidation resistance protein 1 [Erysiphe neolycopersici]|uniref:Oxidation resistance protein 1 n=1 Tax=Erysiphe neolycopersici TaxID=212602 RepID=A0A420I1R4_9PEZI|nr:Oxidation resistance protein 1 [Erysiphe neolycopersici]
MATKYNRQKDNNKKRSPVLKTSVPSLATLGSWGVPSVSHAVTELFRRFVPEQTYVNHGSSSGQVSFNDDFDENFISQSKYTSFTPSTSLCPISLRYESYSDQHYTKLLTKSLAEEIRLLIPPRLQLCEEWHIVYGLEKDGACLGTLYKKCNELQEGLNGFVLVVKDGRGDVFGAYLNEAPRIEPSFFGNGECFLWRATLLSVSQMNLPLLPSVDTTNMQRSTTVGSQSFHSPASSNYNDILNKKSSSLSVSERLRFKAFPYSGVNDYLMLCEANYLSIGGGDGHYGLWLDDTLDRGISSHCLTFGNEPLSEEGEKFDVMGVEVWSLGGNPIK